MSVHTEFTTHWYTFLDTVETRIRQEIEQKDRLGVAIVNTVVQTELSKWDVAQNYSGAWLKQLKETNPTAGQDFHELLKKFRLRKPIEFEPLPAELRIITGILVVIAFFLIKRSQGGSLREQFASTGILAAVLAVGYQFGWPYYRQRQADLAIKALRQELGKTEQTLREILSKIEPSPAVS